jgi:hypothetical protein
LTVISFQSPLGITQQLKKKLSFKREDAEEGIPSVFPCENQMVVHRRGKIYDW